MTTSILVLVLLIAPTIVPIMVSTIVLATAITMSVAAMLLPFSSCTLVSLSLLLLMLLLCFLPALLCLKFMRGFSYFRQVFRFAGKRVRKEIGMGKRVLRRNALFWIQCQEFIDQIDSLRPKLREVLSDPSLVLFFRGNKHRIPTELLHIWPVR